MKSNQSIIQVGAHRGAETVLNNTFPGTYGNFDNLTVIDPKFGRAKEFVYKVKSINPVLEVNALEMSAQAFLTNSTFEPDSWILTPDNIEVQKDILGREKFQSNVLLQILGQSPDKEIVSLFGVCGSILEGDKETYGQTSSLLDSILQASESVSSSDITKDRIAGTLMVPLRNAISKRTALNLSNLSKGSKINGSFLQFTDGVVLYPLHVDGFAPENHKERILQALDLFNKIPAEQLQLQPLSTSRAGVIALGAQDNGVYFIKVERNSRDRRRVIGTLEILHKEEENAWLTD